MEQIAKHFLFAERKTNLRIETIAGATTFLSMLYIVIVNSTVFSAAGMSFGGVYIATILATVVATLIMGVAANYPIAIAPGLGINAYLVFTVVISQGVPWQQALGAAAVASGAFIILSLTSFREMFINSIPESLKKSIAAGIGLFVALIGLHNGHIVVENSSTMISFGLLNDPVLILTVVNLIITMALLVLRVNGAIFIGMALATVIAWLTGNWEVPEAIFSMPSGLDKTLFQLSFENMSALAPVIFVLLLVTLFDTAGTMLGIGSQAGLIKNGKFPNLKSALLADSVGSFFGAFVGTGPTSAFVESGTGVAAGGRTGFASVVTAVLFLALLFFQPLAASISALPAVTAPALVLTGCFMVADVANIDWKDYSEAFPAFLTMVLMPFSYSITNGVGIGMITYVILKICAGKFSEVQPLLIIMAILFAGQMLL